MKPFGNYDWCFYERYVKLSGKTIIPHVYNVVILIVCDNSLFACLGDISLFDPVAWIPGTCY